LTLGVSYFKIKYFKIIIENKIVNNEISAKQLLINSLFNQLPMGITMINEKGTLPLYKPKFWMEKPWSP